MALRSPADRAGRPSGGRLAATPVKGYRFCRDGEQVARALGISVKTADTHVQSAIGVSTRAAALLFAMQHGLTASGELPIVPPPGRS